MVAIFGDASDVVLVEFFQPLDQALCRVLLRVLTTFGLRLRAGFQDLSDFEVSVCTAVTATTYSKQFRKTERPKTDLGTWLGSGGLISKIYINLIHPFG
jgi:hypothetical protein